MASMEKTEVLERLERMITKAERKGKTRNRLALIIALDHVRKAYMDAEYGDCNSCEKNILCGMAPVPGGQVRKNCPHYKGPEKLEPWRGESYGESD